MRGKLISGVLSILMLMVVSSSCGASGSVTDSSPPSTASSAASASGASSKPAGGLALVATVTGLAAVPVGSSSPVWSAEGAVAAPDGSAVFATGPGKGTGLVRLDPRTGAEMGQWMSTGKLTLHAVAPDGAWLALTDRQVTHGPEATTVVIYDPAARRELHRHVVEGDVLPEAFSVDGEVLYTLKYIGDHYRVQTLHLPSGQHADALGRDKKPGEDMQGEGVASVMSPDRTLLSTLYRNPPGSHHPAFVHVVDLQGKWAHCADLEAPFGSGPPGSDVIAADGGAVVVTNLVARKRAHIGVQALHQPDPSVPVPVEVSDDPNPPGLPAGVADTPGFRRLVTVLPPTP